MAKRKSEPPPIEPREFRSPEELDAAIAKLRRRIEELEKLDIRAAMSQRNGADEVAQNNVREEIREVFGTNSPEFRQHQQIHIWAGPQRMGMSGGEILHGKERGRVYVKGILNGLIGRLEEKKADLAGGAAPALSTVFDRLNLHQRIRDVSRDLFVDGHPWEAVFAAAKTLVNYVKERSNRHYLDGAALMRTVFSKGGPILAFNDLADQTDLDEQEGLMHMFEGAVLAIRNPGGHDFPEGSEQHAIEYISFLSLLAYRLQEANRRK
jgi:uncharacterized protein (TIGR02391 family)